MDSTSRDAASDWVKLIREVLEPAHEVRFRQPSKYHCIQCHKTGYPQIIIAWARMFGVNHEYLLQSSTKDNRPLFRKPVFQWWYLVVAAPPKQNCFGSVMFVHSKIGYLTYACASWLTEPQGAIEAWMCTPKASRFYCNPLEAQVRVARNFSTVAAYYKEQRSSGDLFWGDEVVGVNPFVDGRVLNLLHAVTYCSFIISTLPFVLSHPVERRSFICVLY